MKKFKRFLNGVKRLGEKDEQDSDPYTEQITLMDKSAVDSAMDRMRTLIKRQEALDPVVLEEITETVSVLVESGNEKSIYTHVQAEQDRSLLCECVLANNYQVLKLLVNLGVNVNGSSREADDQDYDLPLHAACSLGRPGLVSYLESEGANPLAQCVLTIKGHEEESKNAFEVCLEADSVAAFQALPGTVHKIPRDLLHKACKMNANKCAEYMITNQMYLMYERDENGYLPLMYAFRHDLTPVRRMAERAENYVAEGLREPLNDSIAAYEIFIQTCSTLSHSCDRKGVFNFLFRYAGVSFVNTLDNEGQSGLHRLCEICRCPKDSSLPHLEFDNVTLDCIRCLIDNCADLEIKNKEGYTPLLHLLDMSRISNSAHIRNTNCSIVSRALELLVEAGASLTISATRYIGNYSIHVNPLLALAYICKKVSSLSLTQLHTSILEMVQVILQGSKDQGVTYVDKIHLALYHFMVGYLGRKGAPPSTTEIRTYDKLACCFHELFKLFIVKNVQFRQEFFVEESQPRTTSIFEELLYVMMQDVTLYNFIRIGLVESLELFISLLKSKDIKMAVINFRPDLSKYDIESTSKLSPKKEHEFVNILEYILSKATNMNHYYSVGAFVDVLASAKTVLPQNYVRLVKGPYLYELYIPAQIKEMLRSRPTYW